MLKNAYDKLYCKHDCEVLQRRELTRINYCDKYQRNLSIDSQGNPYCLPECEFRYEHKYNNVMEIDFEDLDNYVTKDKPIKAKHILKSKENVSIENRIF